MYSPTEDFTTTGKNDSSATRQLLFYPTSVFFRSFTHQSNNIISSSVRKDVAMTHATRLASSGLPYLSDLQLNDLYQLQDQLDTAWKNGQSIVSNQLYDKVADSINYESNQLNSDPYSYGIKRTDAELKNLLDYFTLSLSQGKPLVTDAVWDILNRELTLRNGMNASSSIACPSHWTTMSLAELPVQFVTLSRSSNR
jgi:hypothetical protein